MVKFSQAIADRICAEITEGKSLRTICTAKDMPTKSAVMLWLAEGARPDGKPEKVAFLDQYVRARENQADHYADEIVDISDTEEDWQRARIRIDARKWVASKLKSKAYGDRVTNEHTGAGGKPIKVQVEFVGTAKPSESSDS